MQRYKSYVVTRFLKIISLFLCILILGILIPDSVFCEEPVSVGLNGSEVIQTLPRNIVTVSFEIRNLADSEKDISPELKMPDGFRAIAGTFPFTIGQGETRVEILSILVPGGIYAGSYEAVYIARNTDTFEIEDSCSFYIEVLSVTGLKVDVLNSPEFIIAGDDYSVDFAVINESNIEQKVDLSVISGSNFSYQIKDRKLSMGPDQTETVSVVVHTNAKLNKRVMHRLELYAVSTQDPEIKGKAELYVEVIPKTSGKVDRFRRIESKAGLNYYAEKKEGEHNSASQLNVYGKGFLDEERKNSIEFSYIGPDTNDSVSNRKNESYFIKHWTDDYKIVLGDDDYSLSELTDKYFSGTGAGGEYDNEKFKVKSYFAKTKQYVTSEKTRIGANLTYKFNEYLDIGGNFLKKEDKESQLESDIAGLNADIKISKTDKLTVQWAAGGANESDGANKNSYLSQYKGKLKDFSYMFKYIYAEPDHPGYYSDKEYIYGNLDYKLNKSISLKTSLRREQNNLDLDNSESSAPQEDYLSIGGAYRPNSSFNIGADGIYRKRVDLLPDCDFDYTENTVRISGGYSKKSISFYSHAEFGSQKDNQENTLTSLSRYYGSVFFRPTRKQTYSGNINYSEDDLIKSITYGVSVNFNLNESSYISLSCETYKRLGDQDTTYDKDTFRLRAKQKIFYGHIITANAIYTDYKEKEAESDIKILYEIPFGIPVGVKKDIAALNGRLIDIHTKKGIQDAVLWVGNISAVTGIKGDFKFPALSRGSHYLNIDAQSIGINNITKQILPMEIDLEGGQTKTVNLSVTQSGSLSGKVVIFEFLDPKEQNIFSTSKKKDKKIEYKEKGGLQNILVEISSDKEIKRRLTDKDGCFEFAQLRPGNWKVKFYKENLPENYFFEKDGFSIDLLPGSKIKISSKVLPQKRVIIMMDSGETLIQQEPDQKASPAKKPKTLIKKKQDTTKAFPDKIDNPAKLVGREFKLYGVKFKIEKYKVKQGDSIAKILGKVSKIPNHLIYNEFINVFNRLNPDIKEGYSVWGEVFIPVIISK